MECIIYIYSYLISGMLLYLLQLDIKNFKTKLYYEITGEIWLKIYFRDHKTSKIFKKKF